MRAASASLVALILLLAGCSDNGGDANGGDGDADSGGDNGGGASAGTAPTTGSGSTSGTLTGVPAPAEVSLSFAAVGAYPANPAFDPTTASVPAGAVLHITFSNDELVPVVQHNIVFQGMGSSDTIGPGTETTFDLTAPATPGEVAYYCSIGDHRDRGMEGALTVTA